MPNEANRSVLVLDVDGVICDSTEECLVTGFNAWLTYTGETGFVYSPAAIPPDLANYFRPLRKFVRVAGEYLVIFKSWLDQKLIHDRRGFHCAIEYYREELDAFSPIFFAKRAAFREERLADWLALHEVYLGIDEGITRLFLEVPLYIVTGKDKVSVNYFLERMGLDFPSERIFDKDAAKNKVEALESIASSEGVSVSRLFFLDDNIDHLASPQALGIRTYMADWGYVTEDARMGAIELGIPTLELEGWAQKLLVEMGRVA